MYRFNLAACMALAGVSALILCGCPMGSDSVRRAESEQSAEQFSPEQKRNAEIPPHLVQDVAVFTVKGFPEKVSRVDVAVVGRLYGDEIRCELVRNHVGYRTDSAKYGWGGLPMAMTSDGYEYGKVAPDFEKTLRFVQKDTQNVSFRVDFIAGSKMFSSLIRIVPQFIVPQSSGSDAKCDAHADICYDLREKIGSLEDGKPTFECRGYWHKLEKLEAEIDAFKFLVGDKSYLMALHLNLVSLVDGHPKGDTRQERVTSFLVAPQD